MSQQHTPVQSTLVHPCPDSLQQLQRENVELRKYLEAQKKVIASLELRAGRSLDSMGVHVQQLTGSLENAIAWQTHLESVQNEVDSLCDLVGDAMLLQKLEAGKVEVNLEPLDVHPVLMSVSRHLLDPKDGSVARLVCEIEPLLPLVLADRELLEAVLTDLLGRGLKYSDTTSPVVLGAERVGEHIHLKVTVQRFAPVGNREFATEIVLCCRRIEVQKGDVTCQHHPDGRQTVTIALNVASPLA